MNDKLIEMRGVSKAYPGVVALRDVDFAIERGEVRALVGKNGAGKSTLIKVMDGVVVPDSGAITMAGRSVSFRNPADAIRAGVATVHQELSIVPELTVGENIFLGRWPVSRGSIDWGSLYRRATEALAQLGFRIDPKTPANRISVAQRQLVEIARGLSQGAKILILDEPTSSLVAHEVEILIGVIQRLSAAGVGIIYISHRIDEIRRVASSVTIMRDGAHVKTAPVSDLTDAEIVRLMLGESEVRRQRSRSPGRGTPLPVILSVHGLAVPPKVTDASFGIRAGEVLGITGVLGAGRTELLQALVGLRPVAGGEMTLQGRPYRPADLRAALVAGLFMTPEDRRREGAVVMLGVDENLVMANWRAVSRFGVINRPRMTETVLGSIRQLGIKLVRPSEALSNLSGGNQQKVVIGKALNARPRLLLLDEPTRGVDIGAKGQIYDIMRSLADQGMGIVFVSSELEEFAGVCDRVIVLRNGTITGEIVGQAITTQTLLDRTMGESAEQPGDHELAV
jgi:simple sugar transport system ATP-binding protein